MRWQDWWESNGTFETPNPAGPLADPEALAQRGDKLFILDMFPYPSGTGLHVGHPLGFIGTDVYARFQRMAGRNVMYTMGFDAFGLPAEQYAVQTGTHPAVTTDANIATYRRQIKRLGLSHDKRRSVSTTDPEYYRWTQWIFNQVFNAWYDEDAERARPIERADRRIRSRRPVDPRRSQLDRTRSRRAQRDHRRSSSGIRLRGAGQLVPRPRHRRRQRRSHRRRPLRPRELPRVQTQHAAVDDAHHRIRRPVDRRPRVARLDRRHQGNAAQLDRPQPWRQGPLRVLGRHHHRVHDAAGHTVRRLVHGALARAPLRRRLGRCRQGRRDRRLPQAGRSEEGLRTPGRDTRKDRCVHRQRTPRTLSTANRSPSGSPTMS